MTLIRTFVGLPPNCRMLPVQATDRRINTLNRSGHLACNPQQPGPSQQARRRPQTLKTGGGFYFTTLSEESPRAFEFRGLLAQDACAEVLAAAKSRRERGPGVARLLPAHAPALKKLEADLALCLCVITFNKI